MKAQVKLDSEIKEASILHLANKIKNVTNSNSEISFIDVPKKRYDYEVGRRYGNSNKLYSFVGYKPSTKLETGLSKLMASIQFEHTQAVKQNPRLISLQTS